MTTDTTEDTGVDSQLQELHRLKAHLMREQMALEQILIDLDVQDAQHYMTDGTDPESVKRQHKRLATDAALRQVLNRMKGLDAALKARESELIEQKVEGIRVDINADLDAMAAEAINVNRALNEAIRAVLRLQRSGDDLVQKYRGVRGRSTLTSDGHIAAGQITAVANFENIKFCLERHLAGHIPMWRTEHGAIGEFEATMGSQIESLRMSIDILLGQEAIRDRVAPEVGARAPGALHVGG